MLIKHHLRNQKSVSGHVPALSEAAALSQICSLWRPAGNIFALSLSLSVSLSQQEIFAHIKSGALSAEFCHQSSADYDGSRENPCRSFCAEDLPLKTHLSCHGFAGQAQKQEECAISVPYCPALLPRHAFCLTAPLSDCSKISFALLTQSAVRSSAGAMDKQQSSEYKPQ